MFFTKTKVTTSLMGLEAAENRIHEERYILWDLGLGVAIGEEECLLNFLTYGRAIFLFQFICVGVHGCLGVDICSNKKFISRAITVSCGGTHWSPMGRAF